MSPLDILMVLASLPEGTRGPVLASLPATRLPQLLAAVAPEQRAMLQHILVPGFIDFDLLSV